MPGDGSDKPVYYSDASVVSEADPIAIILVEPTPHISPSPEIMGFVLDINSVSRTINILFPTDVNKRKTFYNGLREATRIGVCGSDHDVEMGRFSLTLVKNNIADSFPLLRDSLWTQYMILVVLFAAIFGTTGILFYYHFIVLQSFSQHNVVLLKFLPRFPQIMVAIAWIPVGVSLGLFLEFVFRTTDNISYDQLLAMNPGRWKPWKRTFSTLITAYVFAGMIGFNVFQIGIGGSLLNDFIASGESSKPWLSLAIGFVTGFAFAYVRDIVTQLKPERRDVPPKPTTTPSR